MTTAESASSYECECVEPVGRLVQLGQVVEVIELAGKYIVPGVLMPMSSRYFHKHFVRRWS